MIDFILGVDFFEKPLEFEKLVSLFQSDLMATFVIIKEEPVSVGQLQQPQQALPAEIGTGFGQSFVPLGSTQASDDGASGFLGRFFSQKAIILAVLYGIMVFAFFTARQISNTINAQGVETQTITYPISPVAIIFVGFLFAALMFLPDIWGQMMALLASRAQPNGQPINQPLEEYIQETLSLMRKRYNSARQLIFVQSHSAGVNDIPSYKRLYKPEQYNRREQLRVSLGGEFTGKVGEIVNKVDKARWQRQQFIIEAMVLVTQSQSGLKSLRP